VMCCRIIEIFDSLAYVCREKFYQSTSSVGILVNKYDCLTVIESSYFCTNVFLLHKYVDAVSLSFCWVRKF